MNKIFKASVLFLASSMIFFSFTLDTSALVTYGQADYNVVTAIEDNLHPAPAETEIAGGHQSMENQAATGQEVHEESAHAGELENGESTSEEHAEGKHQSNLYPLLFT